MRMSTNPSLFVSHAMGLSSDSKALNSTSSRIVGYSPPVNHLTETAADLLSFLANNWGKLAIVTFVATPVIMVMVNISNMVGGN